MPRDDAVLCERYAPCGGFPAAGGFLYRMKTRFGGAALLAAAALVLTGCTSDAGPATPVSTPEPSAPAVSPEPPAASDDAELEAAWLDEGRFFAVVTWGSSTCVPVVETTTAEGQTVTVTFAEEDATRPCTADYAPRASIAPLPEGVDPTEDVEVVVTLGDTTLRTELDGDDDLTASGEPTQYAPSAGWFDDRQLVLLTWGSSSCPPVVESIEESSDSATITFAAETGACTRDMVPSSTVLGFSETVDDDDDFVVTLQGAGFDGVELRPIGD